MRLGKLLAALVALSQIMSNPHKLEAAVQSQNSSGFLIAAFIRLEKAVKNLFGWKTPRSIIADNSAFAGAILGGIMIMIVGFATLVLGNYIVYAIYDALPGIENADYNSTKTAIISYVTTVMPLFGLALMVLGFAIILLTLKTSMSTDGR